MYVYARAGANERILYCAIPTTCASVISLATSASFSFPISELVGVKNELRMPHALTRHHMGAWEHGIMGSWIMGSVGIRTPILALLSGRWLPDIY
jgi:hypothetical protein